MKVNYEIIQELRQNLFDENAVELAGNSLRHQSFASIKEAIAWFSVRMEIIEQLEAKEGKEAVEEAIFYGGLHGLLDDDDSDPWDSYLYALQCV